VSFNDILQRVKNALAQVSNISAFLSELMIVSEFWFKDSDVHLIAWIPDINPKTSKPEYAKKHIVYNVEANTIKLIERCKDNEH